jgi:3-oxoacyl-[acyl-carrier-protein] synthase-3
MIRSGILGTGRALPEVVLTNAELELRVDTTDTWIVARTGIHERRVLEPWRVTSDLGAEAGLAACTSAGLSPDDLDCIIVATVTPDSPLPSTAVSVQQKLGAGCCPAFDITAACAGFLYGLAIGDGFIRSGQFTHVLVVGVEVLSRVLDWRDRNTCVLFGDGAGAVVLGPAPSLDRGPCRGIMSIDLAADGRGANELLIPAGGSRLPTSVCTASEELHTVKMNGKSVFSAAVRNMAATCQKTLSDNGLHPSDVDVVLVHQANIRILEAVADRVGLSAEQLYVNIHRYGNTSSASVPIALDEAVRDGRVQPGMTLLLCAFGAGFAWGSALIRW